jgi:hypothetical protein
MILFTSSLAVAGIAPQRMRVKLRRIVQSAESAKHQSPGRKPWEGHAYEPSPERAAQVFGRLCKSLCRPFRAEP